ncbi:hypothetical protein ABIC71_003922 [Herbaspirillum seropedicae]|uniref:zinc ribbon domain-containing protein n=1 Tax=Herbaspirillum seropedicae TaxID=964 RepID=UPI00339971B4
MPNFVNCPHCQHQVHESAPACPSCGAPNQAMTYTSYDQVPWYRRRWALVLAAFVFMPIALIIVFTGDVYLFKDGKVQTFPKNFKYTLLLIFAVLVAIQLSR